MPTVTIRVYMKIIDVKKEVFQLTCIINTKRLKKDRPDLTNGKDLRYKEQWLKILENVKLLYIQWSDLSIADLDESEKMLKKSLYTVGVMAGLDEEQLAIDWQRIKLESQFSDIHIEDL
jgi:hypothetical protein